MALRGVWQLQKLVVSYSDWGGSSRGIRYASFRSWLGIQRSTKLSIRSFIEASNSGSIGGSSPHYNICFSIDSNYGISRAFMESHLPAFKEKNPQLEVVTELIRGQHPHLKGLYKNHNERVICVKNMTPEDVLLHATRLRNALGRKVIKLRTRHVTKHPSVQGTWTTALKL